MMKRICQKNWLKKRFLGCIFAFLMLVMSLFGGVPGLIGVNNAYAEPNYETSTVTCKDSLGSLGWLVCPSTGKISEAVDFLYDKIEGVLVVNPVEKSDDSPIYQIWKYFQGITNIVFIIFLLVVVFSQITGVGITNYGVKKTLPKLIMAAILVNLSFYICSLAVDVSNIFGNGLRGLFETIETSVTTGAEGGMSGVQLSEMYTAIAGGTAATVAGTAVAFETGAIWMLIPLALGALVSVVIGLITIAMRQAVVTLLIMVAPLAMVAYILPNTEQWFKKWRQLLFQMLIFYPAFSLLFGASSVAGWAIIVSSQNGFTTLIGVAVQIFPLFFSWSLMKMSGTVLGTINSKLTALSSGMVGGVRGWAGSHRDLSRAKHLAAPNAYTPSMKLQQFLSNRKVAREEETREHLETIKNRGVAYLAMKGYDKNGVPTREAEEEYEAQARNAVYKRQALWHKDNMNKGLGQLEALKNNGTASQKARLAELDVANVEAFDTLKMEQSRGEMIDYENAKGFHERMEAAINYHMDDEHATIRDKKTGREFENKNYKRHFKPGSIAEAQARARYQNLTKIMEGNARHAQYAAATAAHGYETQNKIMATNMQSYLNLTAPTKDVVNRLNEFTTVPGASNNIDMIIPGLRVLNQRGDTDLVKAQIDNILDKNVGGGLQLGTHASQSLASFLMFDVKDSDPWLRRFGKYINLETARAYNSNDRKNLELTYDEYIKGYHMEQNPATGVMEPMFAKKGMKELMEGTSLDNIERTALSNFDESLRKAYSYTASDGTMHLNLDEYFRKREEVETAVGPQFISASLKYLSGSEQLTSAVKFLTGYGKKQKKEKYIDAKGIEQSRVATDANGEPIYEWVASWEDGGDFADDPERARKYFQRKSRQYITDQTPSQILAMRSDYRDPLLGHLSDAYEEADMEDWNEEQIAEHEEYMQELAEIQTRYGDLPVDEAKRKREMDMKKLRNKMAGAEMRRLLDSTGKLNQIYRTRRSGAANNAKDWLRGWLGLDNEAEIESKLNKERQRTKKALKEAEKKDPDSKTIDLGQITSEESIKTRLAYIENLRSGFKGESLEAFYKEVRKYLVEEVGKHGYLVKLFDDYYELNEDVEINDMADWLKSEVGDPDNY